MQQVTSPAGLLMTDERLLQMTAGMVHSPETAMGTASHLLADSSHLRDQDMQRSVEAGHAQQRIPVSFTNNLPMQCWYVGLPKIHHHIKHMHLNM